MADARIESTTGSGDDALQDSNDFSAFFLCITANVYAQSMGRVSGRVLDQTGGALPGVPVDLVIDSRERTVVTDETGAYGFDAVPYASHDIRASRGPLPGPQ